MLPNFLCIGASKCGTTTLYDILAQHPALFLPKKKEIKYFNVEENFGKGINWYKDFFEGANEKRVGEFTPGYLYTDGCAERIVKSIGKDVKLIAILRNPIDRAISHYNHNVRGGGEHIPFRKAIEGEEQRLKESENIRRIYSYLDRGRYAKQFKEFLKYFNKDQFLILSFENDLLNGKEEMMEKINTFLEIDSVNIDYELHSNDSQDNYLYSNTKRFIKNIIRISTFQKLLISKPIKIEQKEKQELMLKYFKNESEALNELFGVDFNYWYE